MEDGDGPAGPAGSAAGSVAGSLTGSRQISRDPSVATEDMSLASEEPRRHRPRHRRGSGEDEADNESGQHQQGMDGDGDGYGEGNENEEEEEEDMHSMAEMGGEEGEDGDGEMDGDGLLLSNGGEASWMAPRYHTPIQRRLFEALKSSKRLSPRYLNVRNDSYWSEMRAKMGTRKHRSLVVKQNLNTSQWQSFIYQLRPRESDLEIVPQQQFIGSSKSKWLAFRKCERAARTRDMCPLDDPKLRDLVDSSKVLSKHFHILVVSEQFYKLSNHERVSLVFEELLDKLGSNLSPQPPFRFDMKLSSTYGAHVCQLPVFRFIDLGSSLSLSVEAKTPSQWRPQEFVPPDSERIGTSHLAKTSLDLPFPTLPSSQLSRIKLLTSAPSQFEKAQSRRESRELPHIGTAGTIGIGSGSGGAGGAGSSALVGNGRRPRGVTGDIKSYSDTIGLDPAVTGVQYKRNGGIYGHFFRDISPAIRALILSRFNDNKRMIQNEGSLKAIENTKKSKSEKLHGDDNFHPQTNLSKMRNKARKQSILEYDKGTSTEQEMMEDVMIAVKKEERIAVRLQRIRRRYYFLRLAKLHWHRQLAVLVIQKWIRGFYTRTYYRLFKRLAPVAATRIQRFFRGYRSREIRSRWNFLVMRMMRVVLPKIKRFLRNIIRSIMVHRIADITKIQSVVRMYLAKVRYYRLYGQKWARIHFFERAAINIQRIVRGYFARQLFEAITSDYTPIEEFAAIRLQRIFRGHLGRLRAQQRRLEFRSAKVIQRAFRYFLHCKRRCELLRARLEKFSATQIQRCFRGRLDRELVRRKRFKKWYTEIYIPAIVRLQSLARGHSARVFFRRFRREQWAATRIQIYFRYFRRKQFLLEQSLIRRNKFKNEMATLIQKIFRGHYGRKVAASLHMIRRGKEILAGKTILRAWNNFRMGKRYQILLENHRFELIQSKLKSLLDALEEAQLDIHEVQRDIEFADKSRVAALEHATEIDRFLVQAQFRRTTISKELENLTLLDKERGWVEAYQNEYESLGYQQEMASEELRLLRNQAMRRSREVLLLNLEREETEIEMDYHAHSQVDLMQNLHIAEIARIERNVNEKRAREIRREKCKWKVDSNRMNVVKKHRKGYQAFLKKATEGTRDKAYAETIVFEKKVKVWDKEDITLQEMLSRDGRKGVTYKTYEEYATPLMDTYDDIVQNSLSLLRGFTLDDRARQFKDQYREKEAVKKKLRGGQFAPLKEEFQPTRAFDYLNNGGHSSTS